MTSQPWARPPKSYQFSNGEDSLLCYDMSFGDRVVVILNEHDNMVASLQALTGWMREHTGPRDQNSPHAMLVEAVALLDRLGSTPTPPTSPAPGDHTKGPWRWVPVVDKAKIVALLLQTDHRPVTLNDPTILAIREDWLRDGAISEADKALIVAAPDLLDACTAMHKALGMVDDFGTATGESPDVQNRALDQGCAAIAKAQVRR